MRRRIRVGSVLLAAFLLTVGAAATSSPQAASSAQSNAWGLDIDKAMDLVGLAPSMVVGEAGAGDGFFTLPMARRVGPSGEIYANDINAEALRRLGENATREHLANIHVVKGRVNDPVFPRTDLGLVVVVHAFHDFDRPVEWLVNCKKYLKADAQVAIIDEDPSLGASSHFWRRERILDYAREAGFEAVRPVDNLARHLIIVLRPARAAR
jgi:tRNA A58 N-methylase Trm61